MAIIYRSNKRYIDPTERVTYEGLDLLANGTATVEAETVGIPELDPADLATALALVSVATTRTTFTKVGTQTINAGTSQILTDAPLAPTDATVDSLVTVDQQFSYIFMTGYIQPAAADSDFSGNVRFVAHNIEATNEAIADTTVITYAVHAGAPTVQPGIPNAKLTVTPGKTWLDSNGDPTNEAITPLGLNQTALPAIDIPAASITEIELNSADIRSAAARGAGLRGTFRVPTTTSVPVGAKVSLGTITITGATTAMIARVGQPAGNTGGPIFTGKVTSADTVTVYARNNSFNVFSVLAGTFLNVIVF